MPAAHRRKLVVVSNRGPGAAGFLKDAILVNPYDVEAIAVALRTALEMAPAEARRRMRALRASVRELDVHRWVARFLNGLDS